MNPRFSHYLSPLIFPLFPERAGRLELDYNLQHVLAARSARPFDGELALRLLRFVGGKEVASETLAFEVRRGEIRDPAFRRDFAIEGDQPGYLELHMEADKPVFGKLLSPPGYAILFREGYGALL